MRIFQKALATVFILTILTVHAKAQGHRDGGLIVGVGSGPLIGQVMGREGEVAPLGGEVGGMLGNLTGKGKERDGYDTTEGLVQPVFFIPPVPRPVFPHQSGIVCREFIVKEGLDGDFREVTKTVCRDRHGRHIDRHHWRGDDRDHWHDGDRHRWREDRWQDRRGHGGGRNRW